MTTTTNERTTTMAITTEEGISALHTPPANLDADEALEVNRLIDEALTMLEDYGDGLVSYNAIVGCVGQAAYPNGGPRCVTEAGFAEAVVGVLEVRIGIAPDHREEA